MEERDRALPRFQEINLVRITENDVDISQEPPHEVDTCVRCSRQEQSTAATPRVREAGYAEFSASGVALVDSLNLGHQAYATHDVCLFATNEYRGIDDQNTIARITEDILGSGNIYHTIRHPLPKYLYERRYETQVVWRDVIWNLPLPLRPPTHDQRRDISNWISELRGEHIGTRGNLGERNDQWNRLQLSLYFLNEGLTWKSVTQEVQQYLLDAQSQSHKYPGDRSSSRRNLYKAKDSEERKKRKAAGEGNDGDAWYLRHEAPKLRIADANIRNYHGSKFQTY